MAKDKFEFLTKEDFDEEIKLALLKFTAKTFADFVLLLEYPKYKKTIIEILSTNQDLKVSDLQKQLLLLAHNNQLKEALLLRENPLTKNQAPGEELDIILAQLISQQLDLVKSMVALIEEKSWDAILQLENLTILEGFKFPSTYISDGFDSKTSTTMFILKAIENQAPLNVIIKFLEAGILYPNISEAHENHEILEEHKAILEELENPSLDANNCKAVFDFIDKYKYEETVIDFTKHVSTSVAKLPADERQKFLYDILTHVDFETYLKIYLAQYRYCANSAYGRNEKLTDDQKTVIQAIVDCNFTFIENWKTQDNQVLSKEVKSAVISLMDARKRLLDAFSVALEEAVTQGKFKDTGPDFNLYGVINAKDKIENDPCVISIALIAKFTNPACEEIDALSIINAPNISNMHIKLADIYIKYQSSSKLFADNLYLLLKKIFKTNYTKADHEQILPKAKEIFKILFTKKKDASQDNLWNKIESLIKDLNIHKKKHGEIFFNFVIPNLSDDELAAMQKDNDAILQYVKGIDSNPLSTLTFEHLQTLHSKLFKEQNFISFFKEHFANKYPQYWKKIENFRDSSEYLNWLANKVKTDFNKSVFKLIYDRNIPQNIAEDLLKVFELLLSEKKKDASQDNLWNKIESLIKDLNIHKKKHGEIFFNFVIPNLSDDELTAMQKDNDAILQYVKGIDGNPLSTLTFEHLQTLHSKLFKEQNFISFFKEHFANKYPQYWGEIKGFRDSPEYLEWLLNNSNYDKQIFKKIYPYQNYYPFHILSDLSKVRAKNSREKFNLLHCLGIYLEWHHEEGVAYREEYPKKTISDKTIVSLLREIQLNSFKKETFQSFFKEHFADKYPQYWRKIKGFRDSTEYLEWLLNNSNYDKQIFKKIYPYQNYYPLFILSDLIKVRAKNTNKQIKLLNCLAIYLEWYHEEGVACRENHQKKIMSDKTIGRLLYVIRFNSFKEKTFQSFFKDHFADKYPQHWRKIEDFRDSPEYLEWLVKYLNNPEHDRSIFEKIYRGDYENQMKIDEEKARKHITPNENLCTNLLFNSFFPFSFTTGINYLMQVLSVRSDIRYMTTAASLLYSTQFSKLLRYGNHHYFTSSPQYFLFGSSLIASIGYPLLEYLLLPPPLRTINITENIHLSLAASAIGFLNYTSQSCINGNDIIDNALHFIDQTFDAVLPEWIR
ncbi:MAG: hypothetical protein LW825_01395 [Candidatus Jidaibacter sp.]|jgi:hypothetical protein|nr:hypothetical protein [Candidatus Jidaibacter sp.]